MDRAVRVAVPCSRAFWIGSVHHAARRAQTMSVAMRTTTHNPFNSVLLRDGLRSIVRAASQARVPRVPSPDAAARSR
jgi:hypothetical protein